MSTSWVVEFLGQKFILIMSTFHFALAHMSHGIREFKPTINQGPQTLKLENMEPHF